MVLEPAARLAANLGAESAAMRFDAVEEGIPFTIWVDPAPLLLGAPFRGYADFGKPLESKDARVELRTEVQSGDGFNAGTSLAVSVVLGSGRSNVSENQTIWTGTLTPAQETAPAGMHRYAFGGPLPAELTPTVNLSVGQCRASLAVVLPRRLRPDGRFAARWRSRPSGSAVTWRPFESSDRIRPLIG